MPASIRRQCGYRSKIKNYTRGRAAYIQICGTGNDKRVCPQFKSRSSTALPEKIVLREYRGTDGRAPVTGTEWEFEDALQENRARRPRRIPVRASFALVFQGQ